MVTRARLALASAGIIGATVVGLFLVPQFQTTAAGGSDADVTAAVTQTIQSDNMNFLLPSGRLPSGLTVSEVVSGKTVTGQTLMANSVSADHTRMRSSLTSTLSSGMTGRLLNSRLNVVLPWVDDITSGGHRIFDLSRTVDHIVVTSFVRQGTSATVTGTYTVTVQHAQAMDQQGHLATWGGVGKMSFTASMTYLNSRWLMSDLSVTTTDFTSDPTMDSGFQYVPNATKPPTDGPALPVVP